MNAGGWFHAEATGELFRDGDQGTLLDWERLIENRLRQAPSVMPWSLQIRGILRVGWLLICRIDLSRRQTWRVTFRLGDRRSNGFDAATPGLVLPHTRRQTQNSHGKMSEVKDVSSCEVGER